MLWMLTAALATPLVHDPDDPDAVDRARQVGVQGELEPVALDAVRAHGPWSRNGQPVAGCSPGEIDATAVRGHLLYGELDAARERLAAERIRCDGTRAQRAELERTAGLLALTDGDEAKAATAFAVAKGYDPALSWDDGFPADQQAIFEAAVPLTAELRIVPPPRSVDGAPPEPGPLAAGPHGLAVGATALYLRHSDIDDVLAIPSAYPPELPSLAEEAARLELTHVLSAALGAGERVHVAGPEALWTGTTGRTDWTPIPWPAAAPPEPASVEQPSARRSRAPWLVAGTGALLTAGGALLAGLSSLQAQGIADDMGTSSDLTTFRDLERQGKAANGRVRVGQGLLLGGASIGAVGVVWGVAR